MEESRRESRLPTSSRPSPGERWDRKVRPRSWLRKVSQNLIRSAPSILRLLFSTKMDFGISSNSKHGVLLWPAIAHLCFGSEHLLDAVHQILRAEWLCDVIVHLCNVQSQYFIYALRLCSDDDDRNTPGFF